MNNKFDELTKGLAQSVTRRGALKKFGVGIAGVILAALGFANEVHAQKPLYRCKCNKPNFGCAIQDTACFSYCDFHCRPSP